MKPKTIIMLSAKRCGSTAVFRMFQNHPDVHICHHDQGTSNWEPNFWNLAAKALEGEPKPLVERLRRTCPDVVSPKVWTEAAVFDLWRQIVDRLGPVLFDKSPQYLGNWPALALLHRFMVQGDDVRLFAFIRDPRDAITSQFELWGRRVKEDSPGRRERAWLDKYAHLERLQETMEIPLFRYEDFVAAPACYAPMLFRHCGVAHHPPVYAHLQPTSVGRYFASADWHIRRWRFSEPFRRHLQQYGYDAMHLPLHRYARQRGRLFIRSLGRQLLRR
ncbi:MAG: sulfotransferase [Anaerolineae bacterium]